MIVIFRIYYRWAVLFGGTNQGEGDEIFWSTLIPERFKSKLTGVRLILREQMFVPDNKVPRDARLEMCLLLIPN